MEHKVLKSKEKNSITSFLIIAIIVSIPIIIFTSSCTSLYQTSFYGYSSLSHSIKGLMKVGVSNHFGLNHTSFNLTLIYNPINVTIEPHTQNFINHHQTFNITLKNEGPITVKNITFSLDEGYCTDPYDPFTSSSYCQRSLGIPIRISFKCKHLDFNQSWIINETSLDNQNLFFHLFAFNPQSWLIGDKIITFSNSPSKIYNNNNLFYESRNKYYSGYNVQSWGPLSEINYKHPFLRIMNQIDDTYYVLSSGNSLYWTYLNITSLSNNSFFCVDTYSYTKFVSLNIRNISSLNPGETKTVRVNAFINSSNVSFAGYDSIPTNIILSTSNAGYELIPLNLTYYPNHLYITYSFTNYSKPAKNNSLIPLLLNSVSHNFFDDGTSGLSYFEKSKNSNTNFTVIVEVEQVNLSSYYYDNNANAQLFNITNVSMNCTGDLCSVMSQCSYNISTHQCLLSSIKKLNYNKSFLYLTFNTSELPLGYHYVDLTLNGKNLSKNYQKNIVIYIYNSTNVIQNSSTYAYGIDFDAKTFSNISNTSDETDSGFNPYYLGSFNGYSKNQSMLLGDNVTFYFNLDPLNPVITNVTLFKNATLFIQNPDGTTYTKTINFNKTYDNLFSSSYRYLSNVSFKPTKLGSYYGYVQTKDIFNNPYTMYFTFNVVDHYFFKDNILNPGYYVTYNNPMIDSCDDNFNDSYIGLPANNSSVSRRFMGLYLQPILIGNSTPLIILDNVSIALKNSTGYYSIKNSSESLSPFNTENLLYINLTKLSSLNSGSYDLVIPITKNSINLNYTKPIKLYREPQININLCRYNNLSNCYLNKTNLMFYSYHDFYLNTSKNATNNYLLNFSFKHLGEPLPQLNIKYKTYCEYDSLEGPIELWNILTSYPNGTLITTNLKSNETIDLKIPINISKTITPNYDISCYENISIIDPNRYYPSSTTNNTEHHLTYVIKIPISFYPQKKYFPFVSYSTYNFMKHKVFNVNTGLLFSDYIFDDSVSIVKLIANSNDFDILSQNQKQLSICDKFAQDMATNSNLISACPTASFSLMPKRTGKLNFTIEYYEPTLTKYLIENYSIYVNNVSFKYNSSISNATISLNKEASINFTLNNTLNTSLYNCYFYFEPNTHAKINYNPYLLYYIPKGAILQKEFNITGIKSGSTQLDLMLKCDNNYLVRFSYPLTITSPPSPGPQPISPGLSGGFSGGPSIVTKSNSSNRTNQTHTYIYNISYQNKTIIRKSNGSSVIITNLSKNIESVVIPKINTSFSLKIKEYNPEQQSTTTNSTSSINTLANTLISKIKTELLFLRSTIETSHTPHNSNLNPEITTIRNRILSLLSKNNSNNSVLNINKYNILNIIQLSTKLNNLTSNTLNKNLTFLIKINSSLISSPLLFLKNKTHTTQKNYTSSTNKTKKVIIIYAISNNTTKISSIIDLDKAKYSNGDYYIQLKTKLLNTTQYIIPVITEISAYKKPTPRLITVASTPKKQKVSFQTNKSKNKNNSFSTSILKTLQVALSFIIAVSLLFLIIIYIYQRKKKSTENNIVAKSKKYNAYFFNKAPITEKPNKRDSKNNSKDSKNSNLHNSTEVINSKNSMNPIGNHNPSNQTSPPHININTNKTDTLNQNKVNIIN